MELSTMHISSNNWTTIEDLGLSTIHSLDNNWTALGDTPNGTKINISFFVLRNESNSTLNNNEEKLVWPVYMLFVLNSLLLIFGLFGNISGIIVMLRSSDKLQTYGLLVVSLAVTDMVGLTSNLFYLLPSPVILNTDVRAVTDIGCTAFQTVDLFAKSFSAYITVLICIDRFLAVKFPLKFKIMVSRKVRIASLCVCACVSLFAGLVASIQFGKINNNVCQLGNAAPITFAQFGVRFLLITLISFIPMSLLLSLTPIIIYELNQRQNIMSKHTNKEDGTRLIRTSVMLTCVVVVYIILVGIPYAVFTVLRFRGVGGTASTQIVYLCLVTCSQTNHAINICLYNISNKEFREQFLRLFGCSCDNRNRGIEVGK